MEDKIKGKRKLPFRQLATVTIPALMMVVFTLWLQFRTPDTRSAVERRDLASRPKISMASLLDGTFESKYETLMLDQFPMRNSFLTMERLARTYAMGQLDVHGMYVKDGKAIEMSYPLKDTSTETAIRRINYMIDTYLQGMNVYASLIPDKAYFDTDSVRLTIDYDALSRALSDGILAEWISIFDTLSLEDYYATDSHWRQETIGPTADRLLEKMTGQTRKATYTARTLGSFQGVYSGRTAVSLKPDTLTCLEADFMKQVRVLRADQNSRALVEGGKLYDESKVGSKDGYDTYMGGACTVICIENPEATTDRDLYLFSDSFGRSMAPLLLENYSRVWLLDIRYIRASRLPQLVDFREGSDVLFLYSISTIDTASSLNID